MTDPRLLTIIVNYRTPELTLKALEAAVREMEGIAGEIVVVDNGSGDDSAQVIGAAIAASGWDAGGRVRLLLSETNGGFGAGNNLAIHAGLSDGMQPDFHYLLNSDAFPQPGAIRNLLAHMQANRRVGIAGSRIRGVDGAPHETAFRFPSVAGEFEDAIRTGFVTRLLRDSVVPLPLPTETRAVDWVAGASMMLRRRMLEEIGLLDETFFLYFEETDLCLRAARAGWQTDYVVSSEVVHVGSSSTGMKLWRRTPQYWFDSRLHYFVKNHGPSYAIRATLARIAGGALWRLRAGLGNRAIGDPPHFLRDLSLHLIRNFPRRAARAETKPPFPTIAEETK